MSKKELELIEKLMYTIGYTLDAVQPDRSSSIGNRSIESKGKAERELVKCMSILKEIKKV